jgi:hypothetical protein
MGAHFLSPPWHAPSISARQTVREEQMHFRWRACQPDSGASEPNRLAQLFELVQSLNLGDSSEEVRVAIDAQHSEQSRVLAQPYAQNMVKGVR